MSIDTKELAKQEEHQKQMAETWAGLSDKDAKQHISDLKAKIKELHSAELGNDPRKVMELRELMSTLSWCKKNKLRSINFKVITAGPSIRQAQRHPNVRSFKSTGKAGQKRKTVQTDPVLPRD